MQPCLSCQRIDNVQKVSAIISGGTTHGSSSSGYITSTQSNLAQRLSLPSQPEAARPGGGSALLVIAGIIAIFVVLVGYNPLRMNYTLLISMILALVIGVSFFVSRRSVYQRIEQQNQILAAKWNDIRNRWNRLFYCHRCDVIYVDGETDYVPVGDMMSLLARNR